MLLKYKYIKFILMITLITTNYACTEPESNYVNNSLTDVAKVSGYTDVGSYFMCNIQNDDEYLSDGTRNAYVGDGASVEDYMADDRNYYLMDPNYAIGVSLVSFEPSNLLEYTQNPDGSFSPVGGMLDADGDLVGGSFEFNKFHFRVNFTQNPNIIGRSHGESMGILTFHRTDDNTIHKFNLLL